MDLERWTTHSYGGWKNQLDSWVCGAVSLIKSSAGSWMLVTSPEVKNGANTVQHLHQCLDEGTESTISNSISLGGKVGSLESRTAAQKDPTG